MKYLNRMKAQTLFIFTSIFLLQSLCAQLVFTNRSGGEIYTIGTDGSNQQTIITGLNAPREIAYNASNGRIYWNDSSSILNNNLSGTDPQSSVASVTDGFGLALDLTNSNMYYTENPATSALHRIPIGGGTDSIIASIGGDNLGDIAVDTSNGHIYISSAGVLGGKNRIYRTNLDGSGATIFLSALTNPWGLAVDAANNHLYFTERDFGHSINRVNLDGTGQTEIYSAANFLPEGIALDVPNNRIYVADDTSGAAGFEIGSLTLTGTGYSILTTIGSGDSHGIALIPEPETTALWIGLVALTGILGYRHYIKKRSA